MKNQFLVFGTLIILFLIQGCTSSSPQISEWRGPNHDGIYPDKGLLAIWTENGPAVAWKFDQLGKGYSSPAFTDDRFYITGTPDSIGFIYAFDHDGKLKWKKEYGLEWTLNFPGSRPTPTIIGDLGYVMSSLGVVYCFKTANGDNVWSVDLMSEYGGKQIEFGVTEVLQIDGDKVFCTPGGTESNVIALNRYTGKLIWTSKGSGNQSAYCPPVIFSHRGKKYLTTITKFSLLALDPESGEVVWTYPIRYDGAIHANSPIYRDGKLFIMEGWELGSFMLKINDQGTGVEKVWENKLMDLENGGAILIGDNLYAANWDQKGYSCVDWNTGEEKYTSKIFTSGTAIYADGLFYWYDINGKVGLVRPTDTAFEVISTFQLEGKKIRDHSAYPVIYNKKLYLRYDSTLWAFDIAL